jgi:hypothetical protein
VSVDGDVVTLALASAPPAGIGWPDAAAIVDGEQRPLTGAPVGPNATSRAYTHPSGVPPSTPGHVWTFASLDVTQLQSGVSAMRVVRNRNLGGRTVNPDFVCESAVAEFASPVVPLLVSEVPGRSVRRRNPWRPRSRRSSSTSSARSRPSGR